ncbi:MAG: AAA family ATPase [Planctomycetaceae bacterium]|jgi:predicted ATPase|nr:AAA family ATPase [Planctomycetaceae bacterium]
MPIIEGFRVKNYKTLKSVELGHFYNSDKLQKSLTPLTAVIGKNGTGKSSLFDAFGFLSDSLKFGVEDACNLKNRGGYDKIHTQGSKGSIEFEIYFSFQEKVSPITYQLAINKDNNGRVYVEKEILRQRRNLKGFGYPYTFLQLQNGKGFAYRGKTGGEEMKEDTKNTSGGLIQKKKQKKNDPNREDIKLTDNRRLGIATLGSLKEHPRIARFREFIEGWYLSYFSPDAARELPQAGPQKHLNISGSNLSNVVQFMKREHPETFQQILNRIGQKIPGIDKISTEISPDGRLLLQFNDKGFVDPFYAGQMSDGTLKMFSYMLLLEDPLPPPFLCIEEPENGLYHKLLEILAQEFREYSKKSKGSQVFVTTHQPYFVNALIPDEVWILEKGGDGFSTIRRASDNETVVHLVNEDLPLGDLWYSNYLERS